SLIIPNSVTSIGSGAFRSCRGLTEVKVSSGNTVYEDREKNAIIEKSTNTIIQGFNCTDLSVLEEVTSIGKSAFAGCSGLTGELIIPDSITSIGNSAFSSCRGLTSVTIGDSVTSIRISAFSYCSGLTSVYIPSSVTTIFASSYSWSPFYNCSSSLVIYTDIANAESVPSGWGTYWNYRSSSATHTTNYGYTLEQYKSAVGLTFAPNSEKISGVEIEAIENGNSYQIDTSYLQKVILEEKEYVALPKKEIEIA
ncbi:MAG: leucine-rich repeat domain-containing protein, partial [Clostridia bacterium]|nr:leucine-rich repeat domain-containing protein [Clostridia bacterium]